MAIRLLQENAVGLYLWDVPAALEPQELTVGPVEVVVLRREEAHRGPNPER